MTRRSAWYALRASLWFVPAVMVITFGVCALASVEADIRLTPLLEEHGPDFLAIQPEGAQQILATIASSMITVAGVVFSITIVALSLTANQYSPRVLRNFMRDHQNHAALGVFTGGFVYSLLVMQAIGYGDDKFVPLLSVWIAIKLAVIAIFFLIAFIHRTATSIQVADIVATIASETVAALAGEKHMVEAGGAKSTTDVIFIETDWRPVLADRSGYVQDIDAAELFTLACKKQWRIRVECHVGEFIVAGRPLVSIAGGLNVDTKTVNTIRESFGISSYRTIEQDPAFGIRQIVDISLRALSPGVNDTSTAINCIDYLGVILHHAINLPSPPDMRLENHEPRLQLRQVRADHLIDVAFNEIRQNGSANVAVLLRLLRVIRHLLQEADSTSIVNRLLHHTGMIEREAERSVPEPEDLKEVKNAVERLEAVS